MPNIRSSVASEDNQGSRWPLGGFPVLASLVTKQPVVTTPQALMPVGATFWREGHFLSEISGVTSPDQLPRGAWELEVLESVWSDARLVGGAWVPHQVHVLLSQPRSPRGLLGSPNPLGVKWVDDDLKPCRRAAESATCPEDHDLTGATLFRGGTDGRSSCDFSPLSV